MRRGGQLAIFLFLAPIAAAQQSPKRPTEVTDIKVSAVETEVRIEIGASAVIPNPENVATYPESLVLDLTGSVYRGLPRRIQVNRAGIRAVRLWMETENPALTRVVVEIDRAEQYLISSEANVLVLRVGPVLKGASSDVPTTSDVFGSRSATPAARGTTSTSVVGALSGIFHRSAAKPTVFKGPQFGKPGEPAPATTGAKAEPAAKSPESAPSPAQDASPAKTQTLDTAQNSAPASYLDLPEAANTTSNAPPAAPVADSSATTATPTTETAALTSPTTTSPEARTSTTSAPKPEESISDTTSAVPPESAAPNISAAPPAAVANPGMRTEFHVKFVQQDAAYLDGGRSAGLKEGLTLNVKDPRPGAERNTNSGQESVAQLVVIAVAETSAVTEIRTPKRDVIPGDTAYLSTEAIQSMVEQQAVSSTRKYPAVITFSEGGDALDEEAREFVPRRPLPSVNRATGRIGIDYTETKSNDASQASSSSIGGILRVDFTRIGGTYWNLRGYWRGRLTSSSAASQQTLQDLINRTYHLNLTYDNPQSRWVMGVGRMYLPWATSLETLDGGYFGGRLGHGTTLGLFGGSTPDPTSWNYNPSQHLAGAFFNAEGGSYEGFHYSSTSGFGEDFANVQYSTTTTTGTTPGNYDSKRPFTFFENSISHNRDFSVFQALQVDQPSGNPATPSPGTGISRSFVTVRVQPFSRLEFSANHTYFRDIPTFDPQLIGTGLLDKYLFQGFSSGVRVEVVKKISIYTDLGRSSRTGDADTALNQMYGITFAELPKIKLRADAHYSRFTSSFGSGTYHAFSLSRSIGDRFHFEALGGDQIFTSSLAGNQSAKFFTGNIDTSIGALFFLQGGFTAYRGQLQNYNQSYVTLGYRFDNKWKRK